MFASGSAREVLWPAAGQRLMRGGARRRAVTMSTSAVDSLQNALVDTISGVYLKKVNLLWTRLLVLVLTVPCLVVSLRVRTLSFSPSLCPTLSEL